MHNAPFFLSDTLEATGPAADVLSEVLEAVHLTTAVFGRVELGAPWWLRVRERDYLSFYVVGRGSACLTVDDGGRRRTVPLAPGDAVLLPRGSAHELRDASRAAARPHDFEYAGCAQAAARQRPRLGGDGPATSLVTGHFTFGASSRSALLASLPAAIHVPAEAAARGPLGGVVSLIVSESAAAHPGGAIALARLADLLLVHALRAWTARPDAEECPLRAIADPSVGAALRLLHARPAEPWTVARLAAAVGASRSGLAARFTALVGVPPLHYLARWRMSTAARLLDEGQLGVAAVAARVGYANPVAFTKAFARVQGIGPGAFRRRARAGAPQIARSDRPSTQPAARRPPAPPSARAGP